MKQYCARLIGLFLILALSFSLFLSSCDGISLENLLTGENGDSAETPTENPVDNPEDAPKENPGEPPIDNPEENPNDNPGENPNDNPGENPTEDPPVDPPIDNPDEKQPLSPLTVTMIDVGEADSILIQAPAGIVLIDAGDKTNGSKNAIRNTLNKNGITKIDYLVMTHPDADHIGGVPTLIDNYTISNVIMTNATKTTQIYKDVMNALEDHSEINVIRGKEGVNFALGDAKFNLLSPNSEKYSDSNDYSIMIRMDYGENSFLFCGDISAKSEAEVTAKFTAEDLDVDVIKVSHHGADDCTTATLLNLATPKYALISVGDKNSYGHPGTSLLTRLNTIGATVYRTDLNGNIKIVSDGLELKITTDK